MSDTQFTFLFMAKSNRVSELSFQRPHHEVDLVQRAISGGCDANVLCVAKSTSKIFIAAKLIEEVWQRDDKARKIVFLVESKEAPSVKPFLEAVRNQSCLSVKTFFNDICDRHGDIFRSLDTDVIITDGKCFVELLETGKLDLLFISLIVYDDCHMMSDKEHLFHGIVRQVASMDSVIKPKVVGLLSNILSYQTCAQELEMFLANIEQAFGCKADISSDLLAMNKYGEQASEEIITYSYDQREDPLHQKCLHILQSTLVFLNDYQTGEATLPCIIFVKHVVSECQRVILLLGALCTINVAQAIIKEITKMEKKCSNSDSILILQFCSTQLNLIINVIKRGLAENCNENITKLVAKLLDILIRDFKPLCFGTNQDDCSVSCQESHWSASESMNVDLNSAKGIYYPLHTDELPSCANSCHCSTELKSCSTSSETDGQKACHPDLISQDSELLNSINLRKQSDIHPLCVILVPTTIIAKALNALMNRLSNSKKELMFLKSGFLHGDYSDRNGGLVEQADNIMWCVQDGSIKVIISTFGAEDRIFIPRCALAVHLGMPKRYENYLNVKQKLRTAGAKFVVCCREENKTECENRYKNFKKIESILQKRCPNCRPPCQEVANLFKEESLDCYEPFGEEGPKVDLLSSISLVNRYCSKFPSMGAGSAVVVCRTDEKWTDDNIEFLCTICLPRNSPLYHPIKGAASLKRGDASEVMVMKARVKAEMYAALETCRQLHQAGELNEELEPIMRYTMFNLTAESKQCDDEVADSGHGMAGSFKRNRAYKRKFPSLLEHNLPVAGDPCYLYSIEMTLTKALNFERAIRSQNVAHHSATTYSLGILSRKPLPKLPGIVIFDRAGEVTVTVTECQSQPITMTTEQILLIRRFHGFVFREIAKPANVSLERSLIFDPVTADYGFYIVLLIDTPSENLPGTQSSPSKAKQPARLIAFDFVKSLEHALGSFDSPVDPPPPPIHEVERFRDSVVTTTHSERLRRYYVVDIRYDCSPADPFPNPEVAKTFSEYYQVRYGIEVTPNQPLLDVDHTHSRLNCLIPRYQSVKGTDLVIPGNHSKRTKKSKVFVVPELCSIHPVPGYLWCQMCTLPAVLYRIDSLLVAEELRSSLARELGIGAVNWPSEVPLPLLTLGEMTGEEITCQSEMKKNVSFEEVNPCQSKATKDVPDGEHLSSHKEIIHHVLFGQNITCQTENPKEIVLGEKITCQREITEEIPLNHATQNIGKQPGTQVNDEFLQQFEHLNVKLKHRHIHMRNTTNNFDGLSFIPSHTGGMAVTLNGKTVNETISNDNARKTLELREHLPIIRDIVPRTGQTDSFSSEKAFNQPGCGSVLAVDSADLENNSAPVTIWNDPYLSSLYQACGPSVTLTLRALTSGGAGDVFSLERLETYGDAFVKYAISSSLFFRHPYENEGKLSFIRGLAVSNRQLFYLARRRGLPSYIFTQTFLPLVNWIPPGFYVNKNSLSEYLLPLTPVESIHEMEKEGDEFMVVAVGMPAEGSSSEGHCSRDRLNSYLHHSCSDKTVADATEALIGTYVSCFGAKGAYKFMNWLGMSLTVPSVIEKQLTKLHSHVQGPSDTADVNYATKPPHDSRVLPDRGLVKTAAKEEHGKIGSVLLFPQKCDQFDTFRQIEDVLKYRFANRSLLLQAFTHTSLPRGYNAIHNSYEQLEFLGDAVLDFLVTRHLFLCHRHLSPGELTDLRSAVVNNFSFAALAVKFGFPKLLRSLSPSLFRTVNKFVTRLQERMLNQRQVKPDQVYAYAFVVAGEDGEEAVGVEVPKPLGDVFEAVAGAIYVDCAQDLDRVWQVYLPILQPSIECYSKQPPLSPVRELLEMMPNAVKFSPAENMVDGKVRCTLTIAGCGRFVGVGRNFRIAKSTAAQRALSTLKHSQYQQKSKTTE